MVNRQYYYLISLLPTLVFGNKSPISFETFMQYCETHLNPKDNEILHKITTNGNNHAVYNRFYDEWNLWDHEFKKELGHARAARISPGGENPSFQPRTDKQTQEMIHQILSAKNPLETEMILARIRWKHIDEMEFGYYFDFEKIVAYALKLKIMARIESFEPVKGGIKFKETLDAILLRTAPETSAGFVEKASENG
ncbi:MAG: DUF2764 family protein [Pseudomonadota bacterium]